METDELISLPFSGDTSSLFHRKRGSRRKVQEKWATPIFLVLFARFLSSWGVGLLFQLPVGRAAVGALHLVAVTAVDGFIASGQEGHLGLIAAARAGHAIHLARLALAYIAAAKATPTAVAAAAGLLARCPAGRAARRGIRQPPAGEKLLLTHTESELLITVATIQNLIHVCHIHSLFQD